MSIAEIIERTWESLTSGERAQMQYPERGALPSAKLIGPA